MSPKIYFITGVCGSGKTSVIEPLKNLLPSEQYDIHDLDERGVSGQGGREARLTETKYFIALGKDNLEKGISTIICGFARPSEMKELSPEQENIDFVLLDAQPETIQTRIKSRYSTPEKEKTFVEKHSKTVKQFADENSSFVGVLREEFLETGYAIIATNDKNPEQVAEEISKIILN